MGQTRFLFLQLFIYFMMQPATLFLFKIFQKLNRVYLALLDYPKRLPKTDVPFWMFFFFKIFEFADATSHGGH